MYHTGWMNKLKLSFLDLAVHPHKLPYCIGILILKLAMLMLFSLSALRVRLSMTSQSTGPLGSSLASGSSSYLYLHVTAESSDKHTRTEKQKKYSMQNRSWKQYCLPWTWLYFFIFGTKQGTSIQPILRVLIWYQCWDQCYWCLVKPPTTIWQHLDSEGGTKYKVHVLDSCIDLHC